MLPSRAHVVMSLAFISEFSISDAEILFFGGEKLENDFHLLAADLGIKLVDLGETQGKFYDELYVLPWFAGVETSSIISQFQFDKFFLYTDGARNNLYSLLVPIDRLTGLVFTGFELKETAFRSTLDKEMVLTNRVIDHASISDVYARLFDNFDTYKPTDSLKECDFLLVSRYWGLPVMYPVSNSIDIENEIANLICKNPKISRVVIRPDIRYSSSNTIDYSRLEAILISKGKTVLGWNELFPLISEFEFITNPEAIFRVFSQNPGGIFAFDGTFNIIAGYLGLGKKIVWPSSDLVEKLLSTGRSQRFVLEQLSWMKDYVAWLDDESTSPIQFSAEVLGYELFSIFAEFNTGSFVDKKNEFSEKNKKLKRETTQERDALTQERDALTQERDALTQERDALTQERDALVNSTIWRSTRFIRTLVSFARRSKGTPE